MSDNIELAISGPVYDDLLSFVTGLSETQEPRKGCPLCNSNNKADAESLYERQNNIQAVVNLLRDRGEDISYHRVRKHLQHHYLIDQSSLNMKELAERLVKWEKLDTTDAVLFERYIRLLDMEAMALLAENPSLPLFERRKNMELVLKINQQIGAFKQQLQTITQKMEPVEIVWKTLHRVVEIKISNTSSPEVKRILGEILDQVDREVGDMPIEGYKKE